VSQRILRRESVPTSAATALRKAVDPRRPWRRSSFALASALPMRPSTVCWPRPAFTPRGTATTGPVPRPSTMSTGPPGPSITLSPMRTGTACVTRSPLTKVPLRLPASRTTSAPLGPTVSSACTRETTVSAASTGRISHSLPRPRRMRVPRASKRFPVAAASIVIPYTRWASAILGCSTSVSPRPSAIAATTSFGPVSPSVTASPDVRGESALRRLPLR